MTKLLGFKKPVANFKNGVRVLNMYFNFSSHILQQTNNTVELTTAETHAVAISNE